VRAALRVVALVAVVVSMPVVGATVEASHGDTCYEETDGIVTKSGGWTNPGPFASVHGGTYIYTDVADEYIEWAVPAGSASWKLIAYTGPNLGTHAVYVDGVLFASVDHYSPDYVYQVVVAEGTWSTGSGHTVKLFVTNNKNASSTGYYANGDALCVSGAAPTPTPTPTPTATPTPAPPTPTPTATPVPTPTPSSLIDARCITRYEDISDPRVYQGGSWFTDFAGYNQYASNDKVAYSGTVGDRLDIRVVGQDAVRVGSVSGPDEGFVWVVLNHNTTLGFFDNYSATLTPWRSTWLNLPDRKEHTVSVYVEGSKNASSTDVWVTVDYMEFIGDCWLHERDQLKVGKSQDLAIYAFGLFLLGGIWVYQLWGRRW